jgi:hypothetical protein
MWRSLFCENNHRSNYFLFLNDTDLNDDRSPQKDLMSIELIQTMQWTQLCWETSFENTIDLDLVLPKLGTVYPIKIQRNENFTKKGKVFILWQPPHSELNGWHDKRPSEILKSYVLDGSISNPSPSGLEFDFEIIDRIGLFDFFSVVDLDEKSPLTYIGQPNGTFLIKWSNAHNPLKAKVGDYWYLSGSESEASLELIFSCIGDRICIHYSADLPVPGCYETKVTKYFLNEIEHQVINKLVEQATEIFEVNKFPLLENQIYGAEYW